MSPIRIIVADDHAVVREGIRRVLEAEADLVVVGEAATGPAALDEVRRLDPDVVVLDLGLPEQGGLSVLRQLRDGEATCRTLILTMHDESEYVLRAVRLGVDGYLLKDEAEPDVLRTAVRSVFDSRTYYGPTAAAALADAVGPDGQPSDPLAALTDRELEVLVHVAAGLTSRDIGDVMGISHRTVETHRENMMRKLEVRSAAGLTRIAIESGLLDTL